MSGGELEACTLVEVWCAAGVVSTELLGHAVSGAVWWAQEKVDGAVERWRHMSCVSSTQPMSRTKNSEGEPPVVSHRSAVSETATKNELFRVFMFPSVSRTAETKQCERFPVHQCAVSVLCISSAPAFVTDSLNHCTVHDQLWRTKRLFRFSRYIFSSLAMLPAIRCWGSRALRDSLRPNLQPCWKMGYSNSVRVIGEEEREMLVRLAGCPSSACVSVGRRASQLAGVARLHLSPSTAHQIVLLKFSASGGRGHQSEGSALLLLKPESAVSPHSVCVSCLRHAGVIVSAPFFSMRFGCRLTYAWVWDQTSWGLLQSRHCAVKLPGRRQEISPEAMGEAEYNEDATGVPVNLALFVSSVGKLTSLLPYLCNSPPDVRTAPGPVMHCGSRKPRRDSSRAALSLKRWRMMESLLCDGEICRPVEVVRLGSLGGW
ncbi:hypothetical protein ERJ75_001447500 [Trypanosoma vivax]|nr:hypothetical protein ERJ75_001447500 [Trypanosoma vivax]